MAGTSSSSSSQTMARYRALLGHVGFLNNAQTSLGGKPFPPLGPPILK
jgi:hypothetical protein